MIMQRFVEKRIIPHIEDTAGMGPKDTLERLQTKGFARRLLAIDSGASQIASGLTFGWPRKSVALAALAVDYGLVLVPKITHMLSYSNAQVTKGNSLQNAWGTITNTYNDVTLVIGATVATLAMFWLARSDKENFEQSRIEDGQETLSTLTFKAARTLALLAVGAHLVLNIPEAFSGTWSYLADAASKLSLLMTLYLISPTSDIVKKLLGFAANCFGRILESRGASADEVSKSIDEFLG